MAIPAPHPDDVASTRRRLLLAVPVCVLFAIGFWWLNSNMFVSAEMGELRGERGNGCVVSAVVDVARTRRGHDEASVRLLIDLPVLLGQPTEKAA